ncbi:MAG: hypothetical protein ACM3SS_06900 [Rhodospirillaceae bacterium]
MIRLVVRTCDAGMAANVGGEVCVEYKTFDVDVPELEAFLREVGTYSFKNIVGAELLDAKEAKHE